MKIDKPEREAEMSIPSKCISHIESIPIKCKVCYIDFEGLSDGKSIKNIIPQVSPKKIVNFLFSIIFLLYSLSYFIS